MDADLPGSDRVDDRWSEGSELHEPLGGETGLDDLVRTLRAGDGMPVPLAAHHEPALLQGGRDGGPSLIPVESAELGRHPLADQARALVEDRGRDLDLRVALRDLVVEQIVLGRDLEGAVPELRIDRRVGDDRDDAVGQRDPDGPAHRPAVSVVVRMDRHRRVPEDRLGAHGGDDDPPGAPIGPRVVEEEEIRLLLAMDHLEVGDGGPKPGVPVRPSAPPDR